MLIMERSEPALVPEWLKTSGSISGCGNANQPAVSSSSHSDNHVTVHSTRNRSSMSSNDYDSPRSFTHLDRTSSSYLNRSSSSNGSMIHEKESLGYSRSHSSSSRSHRDWDRDKDLIKFRNKDKSVPDHDRDNNRAAPLGISANSLSNSIDNDALRHSRSMIAVKRGELWPRQVPGNLNGSNKGNYGNKNCSVVRGTVNGSVKTLFEKDFPSLGTEERQGSSDIARLSSPRLSSAAQNLPIGTSVVIGGDGWTSALAEVPVIIGSNTMGLSSVQQSSTANAAPSTTGGLNMAATLAQPPPRAHATPQLSVETQRLEELAIKQSRQLVPMTPSMPKTSVLNSEKPKPRATGRSEMSLASKIGQQNQSSLNVVNHPLRVGQTSSDVTKSSQFGKLLVLKPARENNGSVPATKSSMSPTSAGAVTSNPLASASSPTYASRRLNNSNLASAERKASALPVNRSSPMEKRPTLSQVQSRNDFFNLMRKKTSMNLSSGSPDQSPMLSTTISEKSGESSTNVVNVATSQINDGPSSDPACVDWSSENRINLASNGDVYEDPQRCSDNGDEHSEPVEVYSNEEEIAFLRSLGWEENAGEEGLTEDEIHAFYKEYAQLQIASKHCQGFQQQKLLSLLKCHGGSLDSASSGLSSSDIESNAR